MPSEQPPSMASKITQTSPFQRIRTEILKHPITAFFLLTFGWTWTYDLILYLSVGQSPSMMPPLTLPRTWGPLFATSVVLTSRGESFPRFLGKVVSLPSRLWILIVAFILPIVFGEYHTILAILSSRPVSGPAYHPLMYVVNFLGVFLLAGSLEEFGWRAFAQPRLQVRYSAVFVALSLGFVWATWHLPLFLMFDLGAYDPSNLPVYYLSLMIDSVVLAWLFNETGDSVVAPMTYHAAGNMPALMTVSGSLPGILGVIDEYGYLVSIAVLAGVIIAVKGTDLAARSSHLT